MTDALNQAMALLGKDSLTVEDGKSLLALEQQIDPDKFGDLWSAFVTATGPEIAFQAEQDFEAAA
ncbi:hypothetical protein [Kiloniella litopenaei]|uniref:hypothetical protein n=1 Tax=Kiloniella litopenaei TaxID=1549748 RepID=UPI003BABE729